LIFFFFIQQYILSASTGSSSVPFAIKAELAVGTVMSD